MSKKLIAGAGVIAIGLVVAVGIAVAAPRLSGSSGNGPGGFDGGGPGGFRGGPGGAGIIAGIDGSSFTLTTSDGSTTRVVTTGDTTYAATVTGAVSDLDAGATIVVTGQQSENAIAAEGISEVDASLGAPGGFRGGGGSDGGTGQPPADGQGPPPFDQGQPPADGQGGPGGFGGTMGNLTMGAVASVDGSTITVTTADDTTVTVTTSASTTVTLRRSSSFGDLAVGDSVQVVGQRDGDTLTAQSVNEGDASGGFGGMGRPGGGQNDASGRGQGRRTGTTSTVGPS